MTFKKLIIVLLFLSISAFATGQKSPSYGLNAGITSSQISSILTVNGEEVSAAEWVGNGRLGLHFGIFAKLPLTAIWSVEVEAGYEQLKFESFNVVFEEGIINHLRLGLISSHRFIHWAGVIGGVEVVNRSNKAKGNVSANQLNGRDTQGLYWQGILGLRFYYKDLLFIDARATLPRISSVTRTYDGLPSNKREIVERLQAFKFTVNVPIF